MKSVAVWLFQSFVVHNFYHLIHRARRWRNGTEEEIHPMNPASGSGDRGPGGGEDVQFQCLCSSLCTIVNSLDFDPADRSQMYITSSLLDHFTGFASCSCFATKESTSSSKCVISAHVNMILLPKWCFPDAWNALTPKMFWFLFF